LTAWPTSDGRFILVADNFGKPRNPGWYFNLRANPRATIFREGETTDVEARELTGPERDRAWQHARSHFLGYERFQQRRGGREFPILILEPVESNGSDSGIA
jgi:F420H(2)-dependent quinone reductase